MERFIQSGKGYVGIHSASDTEYDWDWYTKLVGRMFNIHPTIQTARLNVIDGSFQDCRGLLPVNYGQMNGMNLDPKKFQG